MYVSRSTVGDKSKSGTTPGKGAVSSSGSDSATAVYPTGTRLKIRYGKGKIHKVYEAKVLDGRSDASGSLQWLVHYAGWNHRCVSCRFVQCRAIVLTSPVGDGLNNIAHVIPDLFLI